MRILDLTIGGKSLKDNKQGSESIGKEKNLKTRFWGTPQTEVS